METDQPPANRAAISAYTSSHAILDRTSRSQPHPELRPSLHHRRPPPCSQRLAATVNDRPYDVARFVKEHSKEETVLYLAYGSNLAYEKFQDPNGRGIKPLAQINVQVPTLRMTFDLPGIPYIEPCFANSAIREPEHRPFGRDGVDEKSSLLHGSSRSQEYRKDRWHKSLIGVVYEVTAADYAHIIATEGGGASYQDILVDCYPLANDPRDAVPPTPITAPFKAHTLFAPAAPDGEKPPKNGGRFQRPDQAYAQASARYLKLLTDGAEECELPYEYQEYLHSLHAFTITTMRQRAGQAVMLATWVPLVLLLFQIAKLFADENGVLPDWLSGVFGVTFKAVWISYDMVLKPIFGEGERTIGDVGDAAEQLSRDGSFDIEKAAVTSNMNR